MESRIQSQAERTQYNDLQSLLCSTLQRVLRKVEPADAPLISDSIMRALLQMFQSSVNNKTGGVQEDALMAVSTLVEVLGIFFLNLILEKLKEQPSRLLCHILNSKLLKKNSLILKKE